MINRILEVGVAVEDLDTAGGLFAGEFGAEAGDIVTIEQYQMLMRMYRVGNVEFEFMQPARSSGVIAKFLRQQGQGLHHIAFQVSSMERAIAWMKDHHVQMVSEEPELVHGLKAIFLHPSSLGGVLLELIEGDPAWVGGRSLPEGLRAPGNMGEIGVEGIIEVGVVVNDLDLSLDLYSRVFGGSSSGIVDLDNLGLRICYCRVGNVCLKLMETKHSTGHLGVRLKKFKTGLHHVTLKVTDIMHAFHRLTDRGFSLVLSRNQSSKTKSLFIDPVNMSGVCVQLKDSPDHGDI